MTTTTCYRVQPIGMDLGSHRSTTSNDELDCGVHVFGCLPSLSSGVLGWGEAESQPEVIEIECELSDMRDNGDYEGYVLVGNRGTIVRRRSFENWDALRAWAENYPDSL